jgi:hypothetical protein
LRLTRALEGDVKVSGVPSHFVDTILLRRIGRFRPLTFTP